MKKVLLVVAVVVLWAAPAGAKPPKACVKALTRGEQIITLHIAFAEAVSDFLATADTAAFTEDVTRLTDAMGPVRDDFYRQAKRCRKA